MLPAALMNHALKLWFVIVPEESDCQWHPSRNCQIAPQKQELPRQSPICIGAGLEL
ncbi:MAG: hypothetical protein RIS70_338 [Planctomycetota bacterium]